jgi:ElaB/YqjD/DUF883 family membrane-anchored ribosome-binding protein
MGIDLMKKNGHMDLKDKYEELKHSVTETIEQNLKALHKFQKMAGNAAYESGETIKDAAITVNRNARKNPWVFVGAAAACGAVLGFLLGKKK